MKNLVTLAITEAQPGMRLAEDVLDGSGRVLVPGGSELTDSILSGLARRDIATLTVEREIEEEPAARVARQAKTVAHLDHLFRNAGHGPETRQLYDAILDFRMEHHQS